MDTNTILSFIEEIKTDPNKFVENRVADEITQRQLSPILKEMNLQFTASSAFLVVKLHSENNNRLLSEAFTRRLLTQPNILIVIKNCQLLLGDKERDAQANLLRRLLALRETQLVNIVKAVEKASGAPVATKRETTATKIKSILAQYEVFTVTNVLARLGMKNNKKNTQRVQKALENLVNDGVLCYDKSEPNRYRKVT